MKYKIEFTYPMGRSRTVETDSLKEAYDIITADEEAVSYTVNGDSDEISREPIGNGFRYIIRDEDGHIYDAEF